MNPEEENQFYGFSREEQILHIASELERARQWREKGNEKYFLANVERALRLADYLVGDQKWKDAESAVSILKNMIAKVYNGEEKMENVLKVL